MLTPKLNRWHPCLLPDNHLRKRKQDLAESDASAEMKSRYDPAFFPPPDDAASA